MIVDGDRLVESLRRAAAIADEPADEEPGYNTSILAGMALAMRLMAASVEDGDYERADVRLTNLGITITALRRALGQAFQLIAAYNAGHAGDYSPETWEKVQMEAARTNLMTGIHDPACVVYEGGSS